MLLKTAAEQYLTQTFFGQFQNEETARAIDYSLRRFIEDTCGLELSCKLNYRVHSAVINGHYGYQIEPLDKKTAFVFAGHDIDTETNYLITEDRILEFDPETNTTRYRRNDL